MNHLYHHPLPYFFCNRQTTFSQVPMPLVEEFELSAIRSTLQTTMDQIEDQPTINDVVKKDSQLATTTPSAVSDNGLRLGTYGNALGDEEKPLLSGIGKESPPMGPLAERVPDQPIDQKPVGTRLSRPLNTQKSMVNKYVLFAFTVTI